MIRDYITRVMGWSQKYDLPARVVSDRILFRRSLRRRILQHSQADRFIDKLRRAFVKGNAEFKGESVCDLTTHGFFNGIGRFESGGWCSWKRKKTEHRSVTVNFFILFAIMVNRIKRLKK